MYNGWYYRDARPGLISKMAKSRIYKGGLFDGRGKPQPLAVRAKALNPPPLEKHIQTAFFGWRDTFKTRYPVLNAIIHVPNGMYTHKNIAKGMKAQGMTKGVPDVLCLAASADGKYNGLAIEFKREKTGRLSEEQAFYLQFLADHNWRTAICRTAHDASLLVNEHLGLELPVFPR